MTLEEVINKIETFLSKREREARILIQPEKSWIRDTLIIRLAVDALRLISNGVLYSDQEARIALSNIAKEIEGK